MIVTYRFSKDHKMTQEEIDEMERASKLPIVFDEDCPELTGEFLKQLKKVEHPINYFA